MFNSFANPFALPMMMAELTMASVEVIARRTFMMATGDCSAAEYTRMVAEKESAATTTATLLATGAAFSSATALLAPWHRSATANAKRLRNA